MTKNPGYLAKYTDNEGNEVKVAWYLKDRTDELNKTQKALVTILDDEFEPVEKDGKPDKRIISQGRLNVIGYVD